MAVTKLEVIEFIKGMTVLELSELVKESRRLLALAPPPRSPWPQCQAELPLKRQS